MGYTHTWNRTATLPIEQWDRFMDVNRRLFWKLPAHSHSAGGFYADRPLILAGPDGTGEPIIRQDSISFNGVFAENKPDYGPADWKECADMSHETFHIERVFNPDVYGDGTYIQPPKNGRQGDFCKTNRKPYDLAVCLVLINFAYEFGDAVSVRSDGYAEEWAEAALLYQQVTERDIKHLAGPWNKAREDVA